MTTLELTIRVPELAKALGRIQGVVEKKTTMPVLSHALIKSNGKDAITVSATDLEIGLSASYEAKVTKPGAMTVDAKSLFQIVKALGEQTVTLKSEPNHWVEIRSGKTRYRVVGLDPDLFPKLPTFEDVPFFTVEPAAMKAMIDKTLPAVCLDETRFNLTGTYVESTDGPGLRMVATDGHRLALAERTLEAAPVLKAGVIIPRKGVIEMRRILDDGEAEAKFGFAGASAVLEKAGVMLTARLVDGKFPDYAQAIPTTATRTALVPRAELMAALKRTSLLSPDKSHGVRLDLKTDALTLFANNPDAGEASEEIGVEYQGEPLKIGVNFRYLLDALGVLPDEKVTLSFVDNLSPIVITGAEPGEKYVAMPMRI